MTQIRVEQIEGLCIHTDENGVRHICIGAEEVTPIILDENDSAQEAVAPDTEEAEEE